MFVLQVFPCHTGTGLSFGISCELLQLKPVCFLLFSTAICIEFQTQDILGKQAITRGLKVSVESLQAADYVRLRSR